MFISFFSTSPEPVLGADYSEHPDCIHSEDIDFNPDTQIPVLVENDGEYSVEIQDKPLPPETPEQKKNRIIAGISLENLDTYDLEGLELTDIEKGDIILNIVFGGNPHAQSALSRKVLQILKAKSEGIELSLEMQATLDYANQKDSEIELLLTFLYK